MSGRMLGAAAVAMLAGTAFGQDTLPAPSGEVRAYIADSGATANVGEHWGVVWRHTVNVKDAPWLRVHLAGWNLPEGSYLLVRSAMDGEAQVLDAETMEMWGGGTAYFNGDTLELELHAAPGTRGTRVMLGELEVGTLIPEGGSGQCGICSTDDRTPSTENWAARLMPVGCTASVVCEDSTMLTAGHCIGTNQVVQFLVPSSTSGCALVNPPVNEQFPVTGQNSQNAGVGADWGVLSIGTNGLGERPFQRYGELRRPSTTIANVGNAASMNGYGLDLTCTRSQTQQLSTGAITARTATSYQFNADVRGGNSGSALIVNNEVVAVVTHCQTNCPNHGTRIDLPALATALNNRMGCDTAVDLLVQSSTPGALVDVNLADLGGRTDGTTNFARLYQPGAAMALTAPGTLGSLFFEGWTLNGTDQGSNATVSFTLNADSTAVARYVASLCPVFTDSPDAQRVCPGEDAIFSVQTDPSAGVTYRWQRNGVNLTNGPTAHGSVIFGAASTQLRVAGARVPDIGNYRCVASRVLCSPVNSTTGRLTVTVCCPADLSGSTDPLSGEYGVADGTIDSADFFYFLDQFTAGNLAVADLSGSSDPNDPSYGVPDGAVDASDFFYYMDLFVQPCP